MTTIARLATCAAAILASLCGQAAAAAGADADEPVCAQGAWGMQGAEKKYVCLSWRFRGQIYSLPELEQVLAQLRTESPTPPEPTPVRNAPAPAAPRAEAPPPKQDCKADIPSISITISFPCEVKNTLKDLLN